MSFVHNDGGCECITNSMDLFSVPPVQKSVEYGKYVDYHPINTITDGAPIELEIPATGEDYLDLCNSTLYVKAKIIQTDGSDLLNDERVAPVNLFLHSMFSQVEISINGTLITTTLDTYGNQAYIETLLSYGEDAKKSQLSSSLFYKDQSGKFESTSLSGDQPTNPGFVLRNELIKGSQSVDMIGRIHADLFSRIDILLTE